MLINFCYGIEIITLLNETDEISKSLMSSSQTGDFIISSLKFNINYYKKILNQAKKKHKLMF